MAGQPLNFNEPEHVWLPCEGTGRFVEKARMGSWLKLGA